ncbi:hypothetical protein D3C71_1706240 [compost metagenome]
MIEVDAQGEQQLAALLLVMVDQRAEVGADEVLQRLAVVQTQQQLEHPELLVEQNRLLVTGIERQRLYRFPVTGGRIAELGMTLANADDELEILQLLVGAYILQRFERLLQPGAAGLLRLDVERDHGQPVVLEGDERPE